MERWLLHSNVTDNTEMPSRELTVRREPNTTRQVKTLNFVAGRITWDGFKDYRYLGSTLKDYDLIGLG